MTCVYKQIIKIGGISIQYSENPNRSSAWDIDFDYDRFINCNSKESKMRPKNIESVSSEVKASAESLLKKFSDIENKLESGKKKVFSKEIAEQFAKYS